MLTSHRGFLGRPREPQQMSEVVEYLSRDYNRRRLLHISAPMVISNMIGINASFVPAGAMVQPPPPAEGAAAGAGAGAAGGSVGGSGTSKVAVTEAAVFTTQLPVPVQPPPLQPVKVDPPSAVAVSVTVVLLMKLALQSAPQSIPVGTETTFPLPSPPFRTVTVKVPGGGNTLNVAVTVTVLAT